jgi:hypothetical protein
MADELDAELARFHAETIEITGRGRFALPKLKEGLTTAYDASLALLGYNPRHPDVVGGDGLTEAFLTEYIRLTDGRAWSLFCDLEERLNDRRLQAIVPVYRHDGKSLDPFRTIFLTSDAQALSEARLNPRLPGVEAGPDAVPIMPPLAAATRSMKNRTGPKTRLRETLTARLMEDYKGQPDRLAGHKVEYLMAEYGHRKTTTAEAKVKALTQLSEDSGQTANSGK